ncbi:unnamed protein product [Rotaria sp. Silwood2]|nr:unnamed protein product [Rotaria sp. Silwood2]CAF2698972.1 unnamed protein product [Rotaria sp. Silwood2]CAF3262404.1 unnamed protein product [Rotaria sp. Silwood2]CAF3943399.1 unnamed protein product [Rotaria sp. Silwood2]CAF4145727.1 unnamed protein product [Rotaria sp. Silwood2]
MAKKYSTTCAIASTLTIIVGIALLITGSVFVHDTSALRTSWKEIYSLSIYSVLIGILTIIFTTGLLYVVNRKFPALTIVFSILMLVVAIFTIVCLVVLVISLGGLRHHTYTTTEYLLRNYSASDTVIRSQHIVTYIQLSFECCDINQAAYEKTKLFYGPSAFDSCCLIIVSDFIQDTIITTNNLPPDFTKSTPVRKDTINVRGFAEPIYSYLHKRYVALIVIDAFLIILLLISAILGLISEYNARAQYELM